MCDDEREISERRRMRESLDWIRDLKQKDVDRIMRSQSNRGDDLSMKMAYEDCGGIETCILLWRRLSRMTLHVSERPLNELRRLYIRQNFKADDPDYNAKSLAAMLNCSEQFVREALATKAKKGLKNSDSGRVSTEIKPDGQPIAKKFCRADRQGMSTTDQGDKPL